MQTELRKDAESKLNKMIQNRLSKQEEILFNGRFIENNVNDNDDEFSFVESSSGKNNSNNSSKNEKNSVE